MFLKIRTLTENGVPPVGLLRALQYVGPTVDDAGVYELDDPDDLPGVMRELDRCSDVYAYETLPDEAAADEPTTEALFAETGDALRDALARYPALNSSHVLRDALHDLARILRALDEEGK